MINILIYFFAIIGLIFTGFIISVLVIATIKVYKQERLIRKKRYGAETLGCGEHILAVLTNIKNGTKETIQ